ncbi:hypothetical protein FACS1894182_10090 [Bacteroidia bacterium]|nr:hypothetical protein FACS1894182_10090 [Bacteroidia bacterium]
MVECYGEYFIYDKHGNISNLFRLGSTANAIDYLTMVYNGNQLTYVFDEYGNHNQYSVKEYHDSDPYNYTPSAIEFTYDANGCKFRRYPPSDFGDTHPLYVARHS